MLRETLQSFFGVSPKIDQREYYRYLLREEGASYSVYTCEEEYGGIGASVLSLSCNDQDEVKLIWYKDGRLIVTVQSIAISKVIITKEEDEESIRFVFERIPSRMLKVQLKPFFSIDMGMYWEMCEECD